MYGTFPYMFHKNQPNVGKYTSPMDPMDISAYKYVYIYKMYHEQLKFKGTDTILSIISSFFKEHLGVSKNRGTPKSSHV